MSSRPFKSNLGRRSIKPPSSYSQPHLTPSSHQKPRLGTRRFGGLSASSPNVPSSERKRVKKRLFRNIGQENQDPVCLGKSLNENVRSTGETPVLIQVNKAVDREVSNTPFYFGNSKKFLDSGSTPHRQSLAPPSYNGRPVNLKNLPTPFHNSYQVDSFPDLESREQNHSFNSWSVFKKPEPVKKHISQTFTEERKASGVLFHSSPNFEHENDKANSIFPSDNISHIEVTTSTIETGKTVHSCEQTSEISFVPQYNLRSSRAIKSPSPPASALKTFRNERTMLPEEPEPPPKSNILNHPFLRSLKSNKQANSIQSSSRLNIKSPVNDPHNLTHSSPSFIVLGNDEFNCNRKKRLSRIAEETSSQQLSHLSSIQESRKFEESCSEEVTPGAHCINVPEQRKSDISDLLNLFSGILTNHEKIQKNLISHEKLSQETEKYVEQIKENLISQEKLRIQTESFAEKVREDFLKIQIKISDVLSEVFPSEINLLSENLEGALSLKGKSVVDPSASEKEAIDEMTVLNRGEKSSNEVTFIGFPGEQRTARVEAAKAFSDLKTSYNTLKTPVRDSQKQCDRKSCYTPGSLSVCIKDQVRDIFGYDI